MSLVSPKLFSRLLAMLVLGILLACGFHFQVERRSHMGKDVFIAEQEKRWDRVYARQPKFIAEIVVCVFAVVLVGGVYELLVAGFYPLLRKLAPDQPKPTL
jgi:TRAP-type C4-dicarboxylate transport system permease small subunit